MNITEERRAREASTSEESSEISEKLIHHFEAVPLLDRRLRRGQTDCGMAGLLQGYGCAERTITPGSIPKPERPTATLPRSGGTRGLFRSCRQQPTLAL